MRLLVVQRVDFSYCAVIPEKVGDRVRKTLPLLAVGRSSAISISHKAKATITNGCPLWGIKQEAELFALF